MKNHGGVGHFDIELGAFGVLRAFGFRELVVIGQGTVFALAPFGAIAGVIQTAINREIERGAISPGLATADEHRGEGHFAERVFYEVVCFLVVHGVYI
jgi:hypothetical protein